MKSPSRLTNVHSRSLVWSFLRAGFGGAGGQFINFLALPILSRLYAPDAYAGWALVIASATILGSIAGFRFELAIVIPKDEREATSVFWGYLLISILVVLCAFLGLTAIDPAGTLFLGNFRYDFGFLSINVLIGFLAFFLATYNLLLYWHIRHQRYSINSVAQITLAGFTLAGQAGWAMMRQPTASGLIFGTLLGQLAGLSVLLVGALYSRSFPHLDHQIVRAIPAQLKVYQKFPTYSTPYTMLGLLRDRAALFILGYFANASQVGQYAFVYRIMNFPVALISNSLRPVLFQISASQGVKSVELQINKILKWLIVFSTPFLVFYFFFADEIFLWFFGSEWIQAGHIGKYVIFPIYTFLFVNWMDRIMDVLGQQRTTLVLEAIFATLSVLALSGGFFLGMELEGALGMSAIVLVLYNITYLIVVYERAGYDKARLLSMLGFGVISAGISLAVAVLFRTVFA